MVRDWSSMEGPSETFESHRLPELIQSKIQSLREEEKFFDFTIIIGSTEISAHKLILAACSDYFKAMFHHDTLESQQNKVSMPDICPSAMNSILNFCYTSKITLDNENVQDIMNASSILQISEITSLCVEFIKKRLDVSNCLGVCIVSDRCNLPELFNIAFGICLDQFEDLIEEREFLQLDESWLVRIISHDELNATSEDIVFDSVIRWLEADKSGRIHLLDSLMEHVRFALMSRVKLVAISSEEMIIDSRKCRDIIDQAKNYLLLSHQLELISRYNGPKFQPRNPLRLSQRIYAVGGWTNKFRPTNTVERYDPYNDTWVEVSPMTKARCGVGVIIVGKYLYAIGGHDGQNYLNSVERYDLKSNTWHTSVSSMESDRTSVGVVALDGYIYAIGGQHGINASSHVERYDPRTNSWQNCRSMKEDRLGAGVSVLSNRIYVVGGSDNKSATNSVECYDPKYDEWTYRASMITKRKHLGCVSLKGRLFAVGGRDESGELESAEMYDPDLDEWKPISDMSVKRSGIGLVELDGLIYAIGGQTSDERLRLVEAYDPVKNSWRERQPMLYERLGGGVAVYSLINR